MNKRFLFFENFKSIADKLPDDMRLKFYDALLSYVFDRVEPDDVMIAALIMAIKPSLDKEDKRGGNHNPTGQNQYSEVKRGQKEVKNNFEQIKRGQNGQSFLETETGNKKEENNITPKNKFSDENIILSPYKGIENCESCSRIARFEINGHKFCGQHTRIELSKLGRLDLIPAEKFIKPSVEEVQAYCQERNNGVDAQKFVDYYTANGWKVGKNSMKDWRAAVRTWERSVASAPASRKTADDDEAYWADLAARLKIQEADNE